MNVAGKLAATSDHIAPGRGLKLVAGDVCSPDEDAAWEELSARVTSDPSAAPRSCVAAALRWCRGATAGLSLLRFDSDGRSVLHWMSVDGLLAPHEGVTAARDASACGLCLDAGTTILVARPERMFSYLRDVRPTIVEKLIVPLYGAENTPLGTLWVAQHDPAARFGATDARVLERLALLLAPALQHLMITAERHFAMLLPDSNRLAQHAITLELLDERNRRERAEAAAVETRQVSEVEVRDAHHRTKNTLQMAANLLRLQSHATASAQVRTALDEGYLRLSLLSRVHELLYKSPGDAGEIVMTNLLRTLTDALRNAFPEMAARVTLDVMIEPITLPVEKAVALGLFANEVLTNAYKHAFPAGAVGKITLALRRAPGDSWILQITDNGLGMDSSAEKEGLGLTLIRAFATQLHGTLVVCAPVDSSGTVITLAVDASGHKPARDSTAFGRVPQPNH